MYTSERDSREDAGAAVSDQQMRSETPRYPVDRYLVESSKKIEMVNIIDDEIWNSEPGLRPEDEITLRKLHEMLQSTADDLKLLSGELSKFHEPGVQVKTLPTPLDEEFNERVHIEEVVNAKFHGYKILDKSPALKEQKNVVDNIQSVANNLRNTKVINTDIQIKAKPALKKPTVSKNLGISRTKVIQISGSNHIESIIDNKEKTKRPINTPAIIYNEFSYKYPELKVAMVPNKALQIQPMPSINIRSELKEQKVIHLDILPDNNDLQKSTDCKSNVAVISVQHETVPPNIHTPHKELISNYEHTHSRQIIKQPIRKISKISTCESSESANNRSASSDTQHRLKTQKQIRKVIRTSPKSSARAESSKSKKVTVTKKVTDKRTHFNLDEWKRKLNSVYGQSPSSRKTKVPSKGNAKIAFKKTTSPPRKFKQDNILNNGEYIPYSQLTLGGVRVSDIEKELSDIPNKNDIPLSPILDKILSSRENSFHTDSPRKHKKSNSPKILTTSDENLLQEVIYIEKTVSETLSKNLKNKLNETPKAQNVSSENNTENDSYADDFEDEKSDHSVYYEKQPIASQSGDAKINLKSANFSHYEDVQESSEDIEYESQSKKSTSVHNTTYTKPTNLSFKNTVDIFEYVHSVDTQDTATQSNSTSKISLKETQTSPRNDKPNIQPIHNDLWPSVDPKGDVERMFKIEKDFIKKLLIEEYGDLLEKNIAKPSTSKDSNEFEERSKNVVAFQKNTQTSPAHVKSVMTSPTRVKTRTTSPFAMSFKVDHETSPLIFVTNEEPKLETETEAEDLGISINLSSPRFSLRLPQTSREVLTNLELSIRTPSRNIKKNIDQKALNQETQTKTFRKNSASSSSSIDGDISSSEMNSLGELNLIRRYGRNRIPSVSDSSSTSTISKNSSYAFSSTSGIIPLRSEGEISLKQNSKSKSKISKSEGEVSFRH